MNISELRKYRIQLNLSEPGFLINNTSTGVALFDLISSFIGAYLLDRLLNLSRRLGINKTTYYLLVVPLGIVVHLLTGQKTYLNRQLFSKGGWVYKAILILIVVLIYTNIKK